MKKLALALLLLTGTAAAKGREEPAYDCSIELHEDSGYWEADQFGVRWSNFTADKAYVSIGIHLYSKGERAALQRHGALDPALEARLTLAPPPPEQKKPVWLVLAGGQTTLPPILLYKSDGRYHLASVTLFELEPLLAAAPELWFSFVLGDGTKIYQSSIPVAEIRAKLDRLPALAHDYDERVAKPEGVCQSASDQEIVVT